MGADRVERTFGEVVREARLRVGISQEELAHRAGLHRTHVSLLERGQRNPSLGVISNIAEGLGMKPSALLAEMEARRGRR